MGKRKDGDDGEETKEQRRERKRLKKEKKRKKEEKRKRKNSGSAVPLAPVSSSSSAAAVGLSTAELAPDDGQAVFYRKKLRWTVSLLPAALKNVQMNVEDTLRSMLLKYADGIGGILMAFENVKILSDNKNCTVGMIMNELPHIHYKVAADALVFVPKPGCPLTGEVTETCFHSHVSLVVHHYFNASISADRLRAAGFAFDEVQLQWFRDNNDNQNPLMAGDRIDFVCEKLYESAGIISIEGSKPLLQPKQPKQDT